MTEKTLDIVQRNLHKRYARERRFRWMGLGSVLVGVAALVFLLVTVVGDGWGAFQQTYIKLELDLSAESLSIDPSDDVEQNLEAWSYADYGLVIKKSLRELFPEAKRRKDKKRVYSLVSSGADFQVKQQVEEMLASDASSRLEKSREGFGTVSLWLPADDDVDTYIKGYVDTSLDNSDRRVKDEKIELIEKLIEDERLEKRFNTLFFTAGDSREPEQAGIRGAIVGSFLTLIVNSAAFFSHRCCSGSVSRGVCA